ncbi:MAG: hypothetical protein AUK44_02735 [Porphyromonadaceae bacterium CG2_30_38_12]|nr:MAG: hypothetical protein AUK44_02735 [Porphyromonadaceae bacterium CG2_30_38_12]
MKRTLQIALIALISLIQFQSVNAQLTPKELGTPIYNGQDNPKASKFVQINTINDSVTFTQQSEGYNVFTKGSLYTPVTWYATSDSGFVANGAYTVEAKVAVAKSMKNGFFIEMQGTPGKRVKIDIDTTAIYNMTYSPSTAKEVVVNNLDNRGMHTYRVAVDNSDMAHIYRDGVKVGSADADGLVSSSAYYKDIEVIQEDQFFEDFIDLATAPHVVNNATLSANLSGNWDITHSTWCKMGIDTTKANVKVGLTSFWFNNGTTGELKIKKTGLTAGKYKLSFWSKTKAAGEAYKGSITMLGTDPNRPAVKYKDGRPDSIPAYIGTDPHVVVLASQVLVPDNRNFNYREYAFDVIRDRDILITFHNGWSNSQKPGWANMWFDDLRIAKVESVPFIRFGKDSEAGVTDFTIGSLTYDMTGAYEPAPSGIAQNKSVLNSVYITTSNGVMNVNYTLSNTSKVNIQLVDLSGRVLVHQNAYANAGHNLTSISTSGLKGIYLLRVITAEAAETLKVEVK